MKTFCYNIKQAFIQIGRNGAMSLASVFAITAMLLILGVFFTVTVNVNLFTEMVKQDYEEIEIYLEDGVRGEDIDQLIETLDKQPGVEKTRFRSKRQALEIMKKRWGENAHLLDSLGENPLPDSILVTVDSDETADVISRNAKRLAQVEDVRYYKETIEKVTEVTQKLQLGAIVIMVFLIIISVVVVSNTIKLTVLARRKEISIMKYIGASNWFIRGPFLAEGIILGLISTIIAAGITYLIYAKVVFQAGIDISAVLAMPPVPADVLMKNLGIIFISIGVSIGAAGSVISMRKFLDK